MTECCPPQTSSKRCEMIRQLSPMTWPSPVVVVASNRGWGLSIPYRSIYNSLSLVRLTIISRVLVLNLWRIVSHNLANVLNRYTLLPRFLICMLIVCRYTLSPKVLIVCISNHHEIIVYFMIQYCFHKNQYLSVDLYVFLWPLSVGR